MKYRSNHDSASCNTPPFRSLARPRVKTPLGGYPIVINRFLYDLIEFITRFVIGFEAGLPENLGVSLILHSKLLMILHLLDWPEINIEPLLYREDESQKLYRLSDQCFKLRSFFIADEDFFRFTTEG